MMDCLHLLAPEAPVKPYVAPELLGHLPASRAVKELTDTLPSYLVHPEPATHHTLKTASRGHMQRLKEAHVIQVVRTQPDAFITQLAKISEYTDLLVADRAFFLKHLWPLGPKRLGSCLKAPLFITNQDNAVPDRVLLVADMPTVRRTMALRSYVMGSAELIVICLNQNHAGEKNLMTYVLAYWKNTAYVFVDDHEPLADVIKLLEPPLLMAVPLSATAGATSVMQPILESVSAHMNISFLLVP